MVARYSHLLFVSVLVLMFVMLLALVLIPSALAQSSERDDAPCGEVLTEILGPSSSTPSLVSLTAQRNNGTEAESRCLNQLFEEMRSSSPCSKPLFSNLYTGRPVTINFRTYEIPDRGATKGRTRRSFAPG